MRGSAGPDRSRRSVRWGGDGRRRPADAGGWGSSIGMMGSSGSAVSARGTARRAGASSSIVSRARTGSRCASMARSYHRPSSEWHLARCGPGAGRRGAERAERVGVPHGDVRPRHRRASGRARRGTTRRRRRARRRRRRDRAPARAPERSAAVGRAGGPSCSSMRRRAGPADRRRSATARPGVSRPRRARTVARSRPRRRDGEQPGRPTSAGNARAPPAGSGADSGQQQRRVGGAEDQHGRAGRLPSSVFRRAFCPCSFRHSASSTTATFRAAINGRSPSQRVTSRACSVRTSRRSSSRSTSARRARPRGEPDALRAGAAGVVRPAGSCRGAAR